MLRPRIIPVLLLKDSGLVKTIKFKEPKYLGDPINTVKLFNDKNVDEIVILDITATIEGRKPLFNLIREIVSEAFMPVCYGGGINTLADIEAILSMGVEKVALNAAAADNPTFVSEASRLIGSQSVVVSMDVKKSFFGGYEVVTRGGKKKSRKDPVNYAKEMETRGAGEIFVNFVDRDGTMSGYDIEYVKKLTSSLATPVIACGGAGKVSDLLQVIKEGGVSAAAAGSIFVFQGPYRAVLITFPSEEQLADL